MFTKTIVVMEDKKPTTAELEILNILWENEPCTVKMVNEIQNQTKRVGYTTTLKILQNMFEKNLVTRDLEGRSHKYISAIAKTKTQDLLLDKFLDTTFGGSAKRLVMHTLGRSKSSKDELNEIRKFLDDLEKQQNM